MVGCDAEFGVLPVQAAPDAPGVHVVSGRSGQARRGQGDIADVPAGEWVPRGPAGREAAPNANASQDIERVKFLTDGEIVVVSVPKYLWDPSSLVNPFSERFPQPSGPTEIAAMTQMLFRPESPTPQPVAADPTSMTQLLEELLRATPSAQLLQDWGLRMQANLEQERLERMFEEMTPMLQQVVQAPEMAKMIPSAEIGDLTPDLNFTLAGVAAHGKPADAALSALAVILGRQQFPDGHWSFDRFPQGNAPGYENAAPGQMNSGRVPVQRDADPDRREAADHARRGSGTESAQRARGSGPSRRISSVLRARRADSASHVERDAPTRPNRRCRGRRPGWRRTRCRASRASRR